MPDGPRPGQPSRRQDPATLLAQLDHFTDAATGAVVPGWQPATTFARDSDYALRGDSSYQRGGSPNLTLLESILATLEGGADARVFASGLAAATTVFQTVPTGGHVVAPRIMYHGLQSWLRAFSDKRGIDVDFVDITDLDAVHAAMRPGKTAWLWAETATNPTWDVADLPALAALALGAGARLGVDATVTPPITLRALDLGADIVFHSVTKYLNGHSDVLAGALITKTQDVLWQEMVSLRLHGGGILGPFEAWLVLRGLRTLAVRFDRASTSALAIARALRGHQGVEAVLYPGLESHPGHATAARQMTRGFGGMLSILVTGGAERATRVATATQVFLPATSLGGVESLIEHRKRIEPPESAVPASLLRLSVGIEAVEDLVADLQQALDRTA